MKYLAFAAAGAALLTSPALAEEVESSTNWLQIEGLYKADAMANVRGGVDRGIRLLGNGEIMAEADLARFGWRGARAKIHFLSVHGEVPNDLAGTMQGVDNIEVENNRSKLYQAWIEQSFAGERAALLIGMVDLNSEFYQNDAAGLLIAPAFGIGSELAATGPNGPSIFPSTALAARLRITDGKGAYANVALFNAKAGVLGDDGGVDFKMRDGALAIAEAGIAGNGKLAAGYWRYTKHQGDIRSVDADGAAEGRITQGAYLLAETPSLGGGADGRDIRGFARIGLSDGDTTPYRGGWQAGLLVENAGGTGSQLSLGVNQARLSSKFRRNAAETGQPLGRTETGVELTYSQPITPFLSVQPDVQYIFNPSANPRIKDAVLVGLRFTVTIPGN
ncbi:carbohydrate porin [Sphingosinicella sp. BN140058]|uniref:carbohydrate porin n=1 Tax=Sphingosinicella sp. BN140058 TaxID=1892855 RepID=UPI001FB10FE2|nr:carbohydrate porin [Sphingosinicella sp. BN140058]